MVLKQVRGLPGRTGLTKLKWHKFPNKLKKEKLLFWMKVVKIKGQDLAYTDFCVCHLQLIYSELAEALGL